MIEFLEKFPIIKNYKISNVISNKYYLEISFYDNQITLNITPEGDCCSENWFEDFDNPEYIKRYLYSYYR